MTTNERDAEKSGETRNNIEANFEIGLNKTDIIFEKEKKKLIYEKLLSIIPTLVDLKQYIGVSFCGLAVWGITWLLFQDAVMPEGFAFQMSGVVIAGYIFGHTLERLTTIHPVVGMTLIGTLYRSFGKTNYLENPTADIVDYHLRRIYPVIILTKGPLGWNWEYIKSNSVKVFSLATLPWIVECLSITVLSHILMEYPWYWGLHLGSILASVSPAIIVPTAMALNAKGLGIKNKVALLVANAGGLDTAFTEGMFGVINSAIFFPSGSINKIIKVLLAIFIGIIIGIIMGIFVDFIPDQSDPYASTIRSIFMLLGGILLTYAGGYLGWGGTSGIAIMVCAAAAATRWSRRGWPINSNPVSEIYKTLWTIFEPMLFTLSGYYLDFSTINCKELGVIVACITLPLLFRMVTAFLVALVNELTVKESIFVAITWMPKAIVEAVLVRVAADSLWSHGTNAQDKDIASQHSRIIVISILLTSSLGSLLTTLLGPILLSQDTKVCPEEHQPKSQSTPSTMQTEDLKRRNTYLNS